MKKHQPRSVEMSRYKFQVRLATLMLLMVPVAIIVFFVNRHYELQRPIQWQPFSDEKLAEELAAGNTVIVFFRYDAMITDPINQEIFESIEFRREFNLGSYAALTSKLTAPRERNGVQPLLTKYGFTNLMIFNPAKPKDPMIIPPGVIFDTKSLIKVIKEFVESK